MIQPEGFNHPYDISKSENASKDSLYLKQISQSWSIHFDEIIKVVNSSKNLIR